MSALLLTFVNDHDSETATDTAAQAAAEARVYGRRGREEPADAPSPKNLVLVHYCFDQQGGETKCEHCPCEERAERVTREVAEGYVRDGRADWLIVKNSRAKSGTSLFHRAIVIRSAIVETGVVHPDGLPFASKMFKVESSWQRVDWDERRLQKHEAIKRTILDDGRNLLRMAFSEVGFLRRCRKWTTLR